MPGVRRGRQPHAVETTPELVARLEAALGRKALVELAAMVALENERSRFNGGLGLVSQGFSSGACAVPLS